jgi:hypothetical protein
LRRSALGPTADRLQRLARDAGLTLTELVATADTHGIELPPAIRRAVAALLQEPLADPVEEGLRYRATMPATIDMIAALGAADLTRQEELVQEPFSADALIAPSRDWLVDHGADHAAGPESSRVGMAEAEAIRDTFSVFQELDTKYGGAHARMALVQYLSSDVVPLLRKSCTDSVGRAVFGAAAELTYLAGLTAFDSGQHGLAARYFVQALRLASEAEEHAFAGNILAAMSHLAISHGDGYEAVQLAKAGPCGAKSTGIHSVECGSTRCSPMAMRYSGNPTSLQLLSPGPKRLSTEPSLTASYRGAGSSMKPFSQARPRSASLRWTSQSLRSALLLSR